MALRESKCSPFFHALRPQDDSLWSLPTEGAPIHSRKTLTILTKKDIYVQEENAQNGSLQKESSRNIGCPDCRQASMVRVERSSLSYFLTMKSHFESGH